VSDLEVPWLPVPGVSTTPELERGKMSGSPRRAAQRRRQAPPLEGFRRWGHRSPVGITITPRIGADIWLEIKDHRGRVFVRPDAGLWDVVKLLQEGGYWALPPDLDKSQKRRRGK
jgi:hypothetical protein